VTLVGVGNVSSVSPAFPQVVDVTGIIETVFYAAGGLALLMARAQWRS